MGDLLETFVPRRAEYDEVERPYVAVPPGGAEVRKFPCKRKQQVAGPANGLITNPLDAIHQREAERRKVLARINELEEELANHGPSEWLRQEIAKLRYWLCSNPELNC